MITFHLQVLRILLLVQIVYRQAGTLSSATKRTDEALEGLEITHNLACASNYRVPPVHCADIGNLVRDDLY